MQATLDWATIRSPIDGTVIDKKVDVGDMVTPGQALVTLFDPKRMQLVASVRESLTRNLQVGQGIGVRIEGLNKQCSGTVSEIVPEAQSSSRAFQVKVTGPCPAGIYSGMFGRILIPVGDEQVLALSRQAVRRVGQLELVEAVDNGRPMQRAIRTGRLLGDLRDENGQDLRDQVEVLSGLRQGERVVLPTGSTPEQAARVVRLQEAICGHRSNHARRLGPLPKGERSECRRQAMTEHSGIPADNEHGFTNRIVKIFLESNLRYHPDPAGDRRRPGRAWD